MHTVRAMLSLTANYGWELQQSEIRNAFLHGEVKEEIYMDVLPGDGIIWLLIPCVVEKGLV